MPNLAVLSTAHIHTKGFLENLAKGADGRRAYVIWDDVADRGRRYAANFQTKFEPNIAKVLKDKAVDAFVICAENTQHLPLLKKAIPVGKPVFCEKPLATTTADLRQVRVLLKKNPVPLFCGYFYPFGGDMRAVAELIGEKVFGQITRVRFRNAHHAAYGRWFDNPDLNWFFQPKLSGGGAFMDMGTHAVHLLRTLLGPAREVFAEIRNESGIYPKVDDFGVAHFRFASGVLGTVEAAWTQTGGIGGLEITGSRKTLWNDGKAYVIGQPGQEIEPLRPLEGRPVQMDRLVGVLAGKVSKQELKADQEATLDAVAMMAAAYESSKKGKWVKIG